MEIDGLGVEYRVEPFIIPVLRKGQEFFLKFLVNDLMYFLSLSFDQGWE